MIPLGVESGLMFFGARAEEENMTATDQGEGNMSTTVESRVRDYLRGKRPTDIKKYPQGEATHDFATKIAMEIDSSESWADLYALHEIEDAVEAEIEKV